MSNIVKHAQYEAFSHDGGKTYYLIDDKDVVYTSEVANV